MHRGSTPPSTPLPDFFDQANAELWSYQPDAPAVARAARETARAASIAPATEDDETTLLLLVDAQRDFCHPDGSLFVAGRSGRGAVDDCIRICRFVYRCAPRITAIDCTLDTHHPHHVFFPDFWIDRDGQPPSAHREITAEEIRAGDLRPRPDLAGVVCEGDEDWLRAQVLDYCERLEAAGKYRLYLWPLHCLLGGDGHALLGVVQEARLYHAFLRSADSHLELKGTHALTENYSVLAPEVLERHDGRAMAQRNRRYLQRLLSFDRVIIAGEAASHCVRFTVDDLLEQLEGKAPDFVRRITLLEDCMSAVTVPGENGALVVDHTEGVDRWLDTVRQRGIAVRASEDLLD